MIQQVGVDIDRKDFDQQVKDIDATVTQADIERYLRVFSTYHDANECVQLAHNARAALERTDVLQ